MVKPGCRHSNQILILCVFACASDEISKSPVHKQVSINENIVSYTSSPDIFVNRRLVVATRVKKRERLAPGIRKGSNSRSETSNTTYQPVILMDLGNAVSVNAATQRQG